MKRRSSLGLWVLAWLLCALVAPAVVDAEAADARVRAERAATRRLLGDWGHLLPMDFPGGKLMPLVPVPSGPAGAPAVAQRVDRYAQAFRRQVDGAWVRLVAWGLWGVVLAPLAAATVVDGWTARAIRTANFGFQSPAAFSFARHSFLALGLLPCFALVWPTSLHVAWPAACGLAALVPLRLALVHLPPVFTR